MFDFTWKWFSFKILFMAFLFHLWVCMCPILAELWLPPTQPASMAYSANGTVSRFWSPCSWEAYLRPPLGLSVREASSQSRCLQLCSMPQFQAHQRAGLSPCMAKWEAKLLEFRYALVWSYVPPTPTIQGRRHFGTAPVSARAACMRWWGRSHFGRIPTEVGGSDSAVLQRTWQQSMQC